MSRMLCGLAALVLTAATGVSLAQSQPAEGEIRIARLIRELGSDNYEERQRASVALARLGSQTRKQLDDAAKSADPEVRLRAADLIKQIKVRDLWSPSVVTFQCQAEPASTVVARLAALSGNRLLVGDQYGTFQDTPITLDYPDGPFWEVLDDLCRQSRNHVRSHYDTRNPGLVVVAGTPGQFPTAYAGPVRSRITSARRVFIEELDYDELKSEKTHTFQLNLQMMWEDRFRLVSYRSQPELVEAVTDTGVQLSATQPAGSGWNVASQGTHQVSTEMRLHPPATTARALRLLRLKWGLIAVGDMSTLELNDLNSSQPHRQDDVELIVESLQESPGARYEISLVVYRDLVIPDPQELMFQENDVQLLDTQGRPFRKQGQTNSLADRGVRLRISFTGETTDSKPAKLQFTYPRLRDRHDLEITFRDVPLPTARPE